MAIKITTKIRKEAKFRCVSPEFLAATMSQYKIARPDEVTVIDLECARAEGLEIGREYDK